MNTHHKNIWFKAKKYGWGWYPVTWQGWAVIGVYVVFFVRYIQLVDAASRTGSHGIFEEFLKIGALTGVLIGICYAKGEPPRWRWGDDKED